MPTGLGLVARGRDVERTFGARSFAAAKILEVSNLTARQTVSLLVRAGMLKEISGRKWDQLYLAGPIMKVIEKAGE